MMLRKALFALAILVGPATAQTAKVISGDHEGFSRLVVELPGPSDWQLGRTPDGYAFSAATAPDGYDLSEVFDLIRRDRLAGISVNPDNGNLQIGLACACHAIPFEFRPGVIVIDIRDGAPPQGSSFEDPLQSAAAAEFPAPTDSADLATDVSATTDADKVPSPKKPPSPPQQKPVRWVFSTPLVADRFAEEEPAAGRQWPALAAALDAATDADAAESGSRDFSAASAPMTGMRDDLLMQISRSASRGVVELAPAARGLQDATAGHATSSFPQVAIDPVPGVLAVPAGDPQADLTPYGARCVGEDRLAIDAWGREGSVAGEFAAMTQGIVGEFDTVNAEALRSAVQFALHLGFGIEAVRLVEGFPSRELAEDAPLWISMGRMIDGYPDPDGAFGQMQTCDTAAALWATLSAEHLDPAGMVNTQATLRSFSALPLHLRLALGPALADRFLDIGRTDVAQAVRGAIERAPQGAGHEADLIGAKLDLANGDHDGAQALAEGVIAGAGPGVAEAVLALVEATLAKGTAVDAGTIDALAAILRENEGAPLESDLASALILALASGGRADAAFARLPDEPQVAPALWAVLARTGTDNDILAHAILPAGTALPDVSGETRSLVGTRLQRLGFEDQAAFWAGPAPHRADHAAASPAAPVAEPAEAAPPDAAHILAHDWNSLAQVGNAPWQNAARHVAPKTNPSAPQPPLAEASTLLEEAAATRRDIGDLLATIAEPRPGQPQSP